MMRLAMPTITGGQTHVLARKQPRFSGRAAKMLILENLALLARFSQKGKASDWHALAVDATLPRNQVMMMPI